MVRNRKHPRKSGKQWSMSVGDTGSMNEIAYISLLTGRTSVIRDKVRARITSVMRE